MKDSKMSDRKFLIYKFTSPSRKSYIGQTCDLGRRIYEHKTSNGCPLFKNAIKRYGFENFTLEILHENLTVDESNHLEDACIKGHGTLSPNGYNLKTGGLNSVFSDETKAKMSASRKNRAPYSAETRAKISAFHKGRIVSAETRRKISDVNKQRFENPDERKKSSELAAIRFKNPVLRERMSVAAKKYYSENPDARKFISDFAKTRIEHLKKMTEICTGSKLTNEHKAKLSEGGKLHYKNNPDRAKKTSEMLREWHEHNDVSEETRKKLSESAKLRYQNPAAREKMSKAQMGHVISEETKAKIAATLKAKPPFSPEKRAEITEKRRLNRIANQQPNQKPMPMSAETKLKISEAFKKRPPFSPEKLAEIKEKKQLTHFAKKQAKQLELQS